ncbi:MAG: bifunctional UDP-3-O-[3-hydroxymyristoyl] N-acetylglucosamine deacetylase/3-hydroxyacyl-ACP dehydratase [Bacteroidota bacterium]
MYEKQHTLKTTVSLSGTGLHTGANSTVTITPAAEDHGLVFRRVDLEGAPLIRADVDNVVDTSRATTLRENGAEIHQVEHVLSALAGLQIDNALIEVDGPELPIMDGSAGPFVEKLLAGGFEEQDADRKFIELDEPIYYKDADRGSDLSAMPSDDFRVTVMIDFKSEVMGIQHATLVNLENYKKEVAGARTFCFLREVKPMLDAGLIKGGSLDNAIVVVDHEVSDEELKEYHQIFGRDDIQVVEEGVLNNIQLQHKNEPARHKLLDVIGDMALLGHPLKAQVVAARPGHRPNTEFVKLIRKKLAHKQLVRRFNKGSEGKPQSEAVFDINAIKEILPHRYPFLLVDRITEFEEEHITGYKNVTVNEPFFQGHFPGNPIMPGVLIIEAMAQVGGVLLLNEIDDPKNYWVYFVAIDKARFRRPVVPGDVLTFKLTKESFRRGISKMIGKAYVGDTLAAEAVLTASLIRRDGK